MKELVTIGQADTVFRWIAVIAPILGLTIGAAAGWTHRRALRGMAAGLVIGLVGPVVFGLWRMNLALGDRYGFTSVVSLAVQIVVFAGLGLAISVVVRAILSRTPDKEKRQ